jgi:Cu/Ag efflux protein CusF
MRETATAPSIGKAVVRDSSASRRGGVIVAEFQLRKGTPPMIRLPKWLMALLGIAILLALTSPALALEAKGKIKKISADQKELTVTDQNGKDLEFVMDDDAKIQLNDKDTKLKELKKGDEITVTYEKKGRKLIASKVECKRD